VTLSTRDYAFVRKLVLERASISLADDQAYLVRSRLESVARDAGLPDLGALVQRLRREPQGSLHTQVVEAMTTNETSFFRDGHPFETLRTLVLPELIARKAYEKKLAIWSAACATGQEPYSIALLIKEHFPELATWDVRIVGTDISSAALTKAQQGRYSALEVGRGLPASMLAQYFARAGAGFEVRPEIRMMIQWQSINLAGRWPLFPLFDVVFLRNVLIYFPGEVGTRVLKKTRSTLSRNGYLFVGSTENLLGKDVDLTPVTSGKTTLYRPDART
jgi:chemotaxis protein methyltransferase CheR